LKKFSKILLLFKHRGVIIYAKEVHDMTIGDRIKAKRKELKWTQRELANRMGYSNHSTVVRAESGQIDLPQSRILQFAEVLGVTPGYLMGWEQEPEDLGALAAEVLKDPALLEVVKNYRELSEADRGTVAALVASLAKKKKD
jgi:transcriptional regulator with XRE-family HTH domain